MTVVKAKVTKVIGEGRILDRANKAIVDGLVVPFDKPFSRLNDKFHTKAFTFYPSNSRRDIPGAEVIMVLLGDGATSAPTFMGSEVLPGSDAYDNTFGYGNIYTLKFEGNGRYTVTNSVDSSYPFNPALAPVFEWQIPGPAPLPVVFDAENINVPDVPGPPDQWDVGPPTKVQLGVGIETALWKDPDQSVQWGAEDATAAFNYTSSLDGGALPPAIAINASTVDADGAIGVTFAVTVADFAGGSWPTEGGTLQIIATPNAIYDSLGRLAPPVVLEVDFENAPVTQITTPILAELMEVEPGVGEQALFASDFVISTIGGTSPYLYEIARDVPSPVYGALIVFGCEDVGTVDILHRTTDQNNKTHVQSAQVIIQDNMGICPPV
jgi:hypothetical protein